ncbi:serine/threonine-protein kinase [Tsukamurella sp. DT100]|uniref:serine/threonine-protein kinase n=1 Tax=Tsukamurella sp. DT100 TaxID=3393415 RepID=UPI003CEE365A
MGEGTGEAQEIAGYRVLRRLGSGGMGEVFLVQHPRLPRRDALKLLDSSVSRNADFKARFSREADVLSILSHPNIVGMYDRGEVDGRLWLAMEYVAGDDVAVILARNGPMPLGLVTDIVAGAGAALDFGWHEHRITHRDVKPANILVRLTGGRATTVKLVDFGIAKAAGETTSLTSTGVTVGTMSYIAPEAIEGRPLDLRADVYSLGCTAFQMLTGTMPYTGTSVALMSAHLNRPIPRITERVPTLPGYLDAVFATVLAKEPRDRFQDCASFVAALSGAAPVPAPPPTTQAIALPAVPPTTMPAADHFARTELRAAGPAPEPTESSRGTGILKGGIAVLLVGVLAVAGFLGFTFLRASDTTVTPTTPSSVRVTTRVLPPTGASAPPTAPPRTPDYGTR